MKVLTGHLTSTEKKHIKHILSLGLCGGAINKKQYSISKNLDVYTVIVTEKDKGLITCGGSELRMSNYKSTFTL